MLLLLGLWLLGSRLGHWLRIILVFLRFILVKWHQNEAWFDFLDGHRLHLILLMALLDSDHDIEVHFGASRIIEFHRLHDLVFGGETVQIDFRLIDVFFEGDHLCSFGSADQLLLSHALEVHLRNLHDGLAAIFALQVLGIEVVADQFLARLVLELDFHSLEVDCRQRIAILNFNLKLIIVEECVQFWTRDCFGGGLALGRRAPFVLFGLCKFNYFRLDLCFAFVNALLGEQFELVDFLFLFYFCGLLHQTPALVRQRLQLGVKLLYLSIELLFSLGLRAVEQYLRCQIFTHFGLFNLAGGFVLV